MILRPPRSTRAATCVPYTPLFLSKSTCRTHRPPVARELAPARGRSRRKTGACGWSDERGGCCAAQRGGATFREIPSPQRVNSYERSEEHTSELQSLMRSSYALFRLKQKKHTV